MAELTLKKMAADSPELADIERIFFEDFPPEEQHFSIQEMVNNKDLQIELKAIKDEEKIVGFCAETSQKNFHYAFFLGIDSKLQGGGYGAKVMKTLLDNCNGVPLVFVIEALDDKAENAQQRIRRKNFYLKNGFYDTGLRHKVRNVYFEIMASVEKLEMPVIEEISSYMKRIFQQL